jgi:hypothetical protein
LQDLWLQPWLAAVLQQGRSKWVVAPVCGVEHGVGAQEAARGIEALDLVGVQVMVKAASRRCRG